MKAWIPIWLALLLWASILPAQRDTTSGDEPEIDALDLAIEDIIINLNTEEQVDYSYATDYFYELARHPLDLNRANREQLLTLPGIDEILATRLLEHRQRFGALISLYELQTIEGFYPDVIRQFQPFVKVSRAGEFDLDRGDRPAAGPPINKWWGGLEWTLTQRFFWVAETQRGYTAPDTTFRDITDPNGNPTIDTVLSARYAGSPLRSYTRLQARYPGHLSFALTMEKDPGEEFAWKPEQRLYGYDFISGHLAISNFGALKMLVVGDYTLQFALGLSLSRQLGFGKGANPIRGLKPAAPGVTPYRSINENQFMRGTAATVALGRFSITGFYSHLRLDASIRERDTLTEEILVSNALQTSGLHRTPSEIASRRAITETLYGGRVEYGLDNFRIGATHYQQQFGSEIRPAERYYNRNAFRGDENHLTSLDVEWSFRNFSVFGEAARSRSGGWGALGGVMASLAPQLDVAVHLRNFTPDLHALRAYVFSERPVAAQNEQGLYFGLQLRPSTRWTVLGYADIYRFPSFRYRAAYPTSGFDWLIQTEYKIRRYTSVYLRLRREISEQNSSNPPEGYQLFVLEKTARTQARLHFASRVGRDLEVRSRIEFSWFQRGANPVSRGFMAYQDLIWKPGFKFRFTGRYVYFDTQDYDARIYAFESNIPGVFGIPPYYRKGSRFYMIFQYRPLRGLDFWFRLAQTRLHRENSFGTGLEAIAGPVRTEIHLQMRIQIR